MEEVVVAAPPPMAPLAVPLSCDGGEFGLRETFSPLPLPLFFLFLAILPCRWCFYPTAWPEGDGLSAARVVADFPIAAIFLADGRARRRGGRVAAANLTAA